jgi:hypothetical protein
MSNMTHQDKISIIITFIFGAIVGSYLYFAGFATTFTLPEADTNEAYADLVITADSYGKCEEEDNCFAFQIIGDGSYRAIFDVTGERIVKEANISSALNQELKATLLPADLALDSTLLVDPLCTEVVNDTYFRFNISLASTTYTLDTCTTAIRYDSPVWTVLRKAWIELSTTE